MGYYQPCEELSRCHELDKYWETEQYDKVFAGYLKIATETSYALAECQVGYCYFEGYGVEKNLEKAVYWTNRSTTHGDRDGQFNMAWIYEEGICGEADVEKARYWYRQAALQNHDLAIKKCKEYGISIEN